MRAHLYVALSSCVVIALITSLAVILYGARNTSQPGTDMGCVQQSSGCGPHVSLRCLAEGVGGSVGFGFKSDPTHTALTDTSFQRRSATRGPYASHFARPSEFMRCASCKILSPAASQASTEAKVD